MGAVERVLKLVSDLEVGTIASSCFRMAGPLGTQAVTDEVSWRWAIQPRSTFALDSATWMALFVPCIT